MTDHVKRLPAGVLPAEGAPVWNRAEAERLREAGPPPVFAPVAGSRVLAFLVAGAFLVSGRHGAAAGTSWRDWLPTFLFAALPLWYRYLPGATVAATAVLAGAAAACEERGSEKSADCGGSCGGCGGRGGCGCG
ncbi:hypothetical protein [Streptomyces sp. H27-H5]|uniref:hypothetical protein n=1 Tax=Streptomyces sp. H27-H5 TaxID=2996460 RepID=UPI00226E4053|nr:hypothetical protein [Streptomyces sp. H27-H5]MCY0962633.1 hypothetical protein [Streptomyces sp. H27-H5]